MNTAIFDSQLLPDGHLYCPKEFAHKENAAFKVIVTFDDKLIETSEQDIELSAIHDNSIDLLSNEELSYYFNTEK